MSAPRSSSRGSSVRPPADFRSSQPRIGSDSGSRRSLGDSYSPGRRTSPGAFDRQGSQGAQDFSRGSRSIAPRDLGLSRPDRMSTGRDSINRQRDLGSRGLDSMRTPSDRSVRTPDRGSIFRDSARSGALRSPTGRDSVARQIARPSAGEQATRGLSDASRSRSSAVSRDMTNRGSAGRDMSSRTPVTRDMTRTSPGVDRSSGSRGGDSVARQLARPSDTAGRLGRSIDGRDRSGSTVRRGTDSPIARSRDSIGQRTSRSGDRMTRAPEITSRTRTSDASDRLTRRSGIDGSRSTVGRDGPISRPRDSVSRGSDRLNRDTTAMALPRGGDLGRSLDRSTRGLRSIDGRRSTAVGRTVDRVNRGGSTSRNLSPSRTNFSRNAGSQLARSAFGSRDFRAGDWRHGGGRGGKHGDWHGGDWHHGGHRWHHGGHHGNWYHGWHGHGWYHDWHGHHGGWGWGWGFGLGWGGWGGWWGGAWGGYADWGYRYSYPYYGAFWPPAVVYYNYSYPVAYYPPIVYSSAVYTPIYAPTYYAEPVLPVFPSYYYPAYSLQYYYPSLYYAPPATTFGTSFGISADWTAQNDINSAPAEAGAPRPEVRDLPAPQTADSTAAVSGDGNLDRGLEALRAGQIEPARSYLLQAINADPNDGVARMLYTATLVADGQYSDASLALRDSLQVWGDLQLKDFYLPSVYKNDQAQTQYLRNLRAFLSDHPDRLDGWLLTIWSYAFSGQMDQAASLLAEAKKAWPDDPGLTKLDALVKLG